MVLVDPALMNISKTAPSSPKNSLSFSLLKPPYWTGISSAGMYLLIENFSSLICLALREAEYFLFLIYEYYIIYGTVSYTFH